MCKIIHIHGRRVTLGRHHKLTQGMQGIEYKLLENGICRKPHKKSFT